MANYHRQGFLQSKRLEYCDFIYPPDVPDQKKLRDYDSCGVYVIKFMEYEDLEKELPHMWQNCVRLVNWIKNMRREEVVNLALAHSYKP